MHSVTWGRTKANPTTESQPSQQLQTNKSSYLNPKPKAEHVRLYVPKKTIKEENRNHQSSCRNEDGGRFRMRLNDTVRRDMKALKIREEWAADRDEWKGLYKTRYPTGRRWRKVRYEL